MLAVNLESWMQMAILLATHAAGAWDLNRWRYRLFSIAGKLTSSARRKRLLIPDKAPESQLFTALIEGNEQLWHRWRNGHLAA